MADVQQLLSVLVKEKNTGKPMYNARVYIPKLWSGTVTEEDGAFQLFGVASGILK